MTFSSLKAELENSLDGVNRYNPQNLVGLEQCITLMVEQDEYDKDVVLTTLKLYQLNPDRFNETIVVQILLKTLMQLPRSDFALAKCLLDSNRVKSTAIVEILQVGILLESCDFVLFWKLMRSQWQPTDNENQWFRTEHVINLIGKIVGFQDAIRSFACQLINVTFQRIEIDQLSRLLGNVNDAKVDELIRRFGWIRMPESNRTIFIQNHEATIKSRDIEEKLEFEAVKDLL